MLQIRKNLIINICFATYKTCEVISFSIKLLTTDMQEEQSRTAHLGILKKTSLIAVRYFLSYDLTYHSRIVKSFNQFVLVKQTN